MAAPSPRITFSSSPSDRDAAGGSPRLGVGAFDSPHLSIHSTTHSPTSSPRLGGGAFSSSSSPKTSSGGKSSSRHKVVAPARVVGNQLRRNASSFLTLALFNIVVLSIWRFQDGHRSMQANSNAVYNSASYPSAPSPPAGDSPFHLQRPSSHAASHHRRGAQSNGQEVLSPAQHAPGPLATSPLATASCEVCVLNPSDPLCAYGIDNIRLARAYQGSGTRVRRFLEKALRGEKVKIGFIGGSVSAGHGLNGHPRYSERFFNSFREGFPNAEFYDGAVPAMGSAFFSYCFDALIPSDLDLYVVELDINNEAIDRTFGEDDALFRGLLGLPQAPAVIRASVYALSFPDMALGLVSNLIMSNYFDVPVISIRNFLLPQAIVHPESRGDFFAVNHNPDGDSADYRHIGPLGHDALGDQLTLYMREQVCETRRREAFPPPAHDPRWPQADILGVVPRLVMWEGYSETKVAPPVTPTCAFAGSQRKPLDTVPELTTSEWQMESWNGKSAIGAHEVGAKVAFRFRGTKVGFFVWRTNGERNVIKPGRSRCWIDENEAEAIIVDAWYDDIASRSIWIPVSDKVPFGDHVLSCQIIEDSTTEGHDFRILGVASQ